jgi:EmrB/QacA subfamily drug resistance transporter
VTDATTAASNETAFRRILVGVLLAIGLGAVDQSIVTPALPALAHDLSGGAHVAWIVVAYMLTATSATLVYGKLSDIYGRRTLMLIAIAIFAAASILCALAHDLVQLALARALQGLGGGGLFSMAQATIADFVPPRERGRYQGYIAGVWAAAGAAGPPLGGLFVDHLSWRWIFWINLPLAAIAFAIYYRATFVHERHVQRRIDYAGITLFTGGVTALLLVTSWAGTTYAWLSPQMLGTTAAGCILIAAFVAVERRVSEPILPPRLYRSSTIRVANITGFLLAMQLFAGIILIPVFLQIVMHTDASISGVLLIPYMVGMTVTSWVAADVMRRTGSYRGLMPVSFGVCALSFGLLATMDATTPVWLPAFYGLLLGFGIGTCFPVVNISVQNAAEPRDIGVATSTVVFSRSIGSAFGAAFFWTLLRSFTARDPEHAFRDVFLTGALIAAICIPLSLLLRGGPLLTSSSRERARSQRAV